jgi:hypothetical protein
LIKVVDGASSEQSKTIPMASQLTQMILKPVRVIDVCEVAICVLLEQSRQTEYDRLTALPLCARAGEIALVPHT